MVVVLFHHFREEHALVPIPSKATDRWCPNRECNHRKNVVSVGKTNFIYDVLDIPRYKSGRAKGPLLPLPPAQRFSASQKPGISCDGCALFVPGHHPAERGPQMWTLEVVDGHGGFPWQISGFEQKGRTARLVL